MKMVTAKVTVTKPISFKGQQLRQLPEPKYPTDSCPERTIHPSTSSGGIIPEILGRSDDAPLGQGIDSSGHG